MHDMLWHQRSGKGSLLSCQHPQAASPCSSMWLHIKGLQA